MAVRSVLEPLPLNEAADRLIQAAEELEEPVVFLDALKTVGDHAGDLMAGAAVAPDLKAAVARDLTRMFGAITDLVVSAKARAAEAGEH